MASKVKNTRFVETLQAPFATDPYPAKHGVLGISLGTRGDSLLFCHHGQIKLIFKVDLA